MLTHTLLEVDYAFVNVPLYDQVCLALAAVLYSGLSGCGNAVKHAPCRVAILL